MVVHWQIRISVSRCIKCILACNLLIHASNCLNLGLIAGDLKRHGSPLLIKKFAHVSPVFINIFPKPISAKGPFIPGATLSKSLIADELSRKTRSTLLPKLPLILPPLSLPLLPPLIPPLPPLISPLSPLFHLLSPLIHPLPLLPRLRMPRMTLVSDLVKPLKVPILKKSLAKSPALVHLNFLGKLLKVKGTGKDLCRRLSNIS